MNATLPQLADELVPFTIKVPDSDLVDLRDRLLRTRWAPEPPDADGRYGVARDWMRDLVDYWTTGYDWRRCCEDQCRTALRSG